MSKIAYDPTKDVFARWVRNSRIARTLFYKILDLFFLRSWYVRSSLRDMHRRRKTGEKEWQILDAGSGFGQYDRFMLKSFPLADILALDVKDDYLDDCRHYFRKEVAGGRIRFNSHDLTRDSLPESAFDLAVCVDVLEHIEDDIGVMKRIAGALRPGGCFIMHSPSHHSEEDAGEDEFFVDEHARAGYSKQELRHKLEKSGFVPASIRYTYGKWGHRAWVMLIKIPMLWFNRFGMITLLWLPAYYLVTLLPGLLMMSMDMKQENEWGTGILGIAVKKDDAGNEDAGNSD
jgi:2-polyprenyl-3-methyl-5-hydroxy-6-metoxy-1,4-benzoquinol methylase